MIYIVILKKRGGEGAEKVLAMLKGGSFGVVLMW